MLYNFNYSHKNNRCISIAYDIKNNISIIPISYIYKINNYNYLYKELISLNKKEHLFKDFKHTKWIDEIAPIDENDKYIYLNKFTKNIFKDKKIFPLCIYDNKPITKYIAQIKLKTIKEHKDVSISKYSISFKRIEKYKDITINNTNIYLKNSCYYKDLRNISASVIGIQTINNIVYHKIYSLRKIQEYKDMHHLNKLICLKNKDNIMEISFKDLVSFKEFDRSIKINNSTLLKRTIIKNTNYNNIIKTLHRIKEHIGDVKINTISASVSTIDNLYISEYGRFVYSENRKLMLSEVLKTINTKQKNFKDINFLLMIYRENLNCKALKDIQSLSKSYYKNSIKYNHNDYFFINNMSKMTEEIKYKNIFLTTQSKYLLNHKYSTFLCKEKYLIKKYLSSIVNLDKKKQIAFIQSNSKNLSKYMKYIYEKDNGVNAEKNKQIIFKTNNYKFFDKGQKDLTLEHFFKFINKENKGTTRYFKNITLNKFFKYSNEFKSILFFNKSQKNIKTDNSIYLFLNKVYNPYLIEYNTLFVSKKEKEQNLLKYDIDNVRKINKEIFKTSIIEFSKNKNIIGQYKDFVNANVNYINLNNFKTENKFFDINKNDKELSITNNDLFVSIPKLLTINKALTIEQATELALSIEKDNDLFLFKMQDVLNYDKIANKLMLDADFKEVYYEQSKKYKWLDGGEDDFEMKLDKYGIDELILPYNDYNYEILKKTLINEYGKPLVPYKEIDKNSFIAKIPVQNPVPCFSDIGLEYIDVDVGILVHLLNTMYKLWRKKVFKFGAMDIKDSMECILSDLKDYIFLTFEGDDLKIATRVFRLFRWYAEMAMNKCCSYKITLQYGPLYSSLDKGDCSIPYKLENMYIDDNKYIITNSVLNKECSCTFNIDNPIDTVIQATIYLSDGSCDILLNNNLECTLKKGINNISIPLKRLDEMNTLKIYYNSFNNGIIKISKVVISDMVYEDAKIEYYSKIGEGNYFMDLLIKNLSVTAITDIYDKDQIEKIKENNFSISVTLDRIKEYIELHHVNKIKGKRLTIKKS